MAVRRANPSSCRKPVAEAFRGAGFAQRAKKRLMGPMGVNEGPGPRMGPILADEVSGGADGGRLG